MLTGLVLLAEFLWCESALSGLGHCVHDNGVGLEGVDGFGVFRLFGVHSDEGDVVDETQVAGGFLASVVEEAGDALDVVFGTSLDCELLDAVAVDGTCGADVLAVGVLDAQPDMEGDVIVFAPFLDKDG